MFLYPFLFMLNHNKSGSYVYILKKKIQGDRYFQERDALY